MNLPPRGTFKNVTSVNLNEKKKKIPTVLLSLLSSPGELRRALSDPWGGERCLSLFFYSTLSLPPQDCHHRLKACQVVSLCWVPVND